MEIAIVATGTPEYDSFPEPNHGTVTQIWGLAKEFSKLDHQVTIYAGTLGSSRSKNIGDNIEIKEVPLPNIDSSINNVFSKLIFSRRVAKRLENSDVDIVHLRHRITALFPSRLDIPSVYTVISPDSFEFFYEYSLEKNLMNHFLFRYKKYIEFKVLSNVDRIGVINKWMKTYLRKMGFTETYFLPMGIPESELPNINQKPWEKTITFVGRFDQLKRPLWALDVFNKIDDEEFRLEMIGDGSFDSKIKSRIIDLNLDDRVDLTGWIDRQEVLSRMYRSSILIHPAKFEMGGNALLEGMASGCGVVTSDTMGATTLIDDGKNGVIFHGSHQQDMKKSLNNIINTGSYKKLGTNAHRKVRENYIMEIVSQEYIKCFNDLLNSVE